MTARIVLALLLLAAPTAARATDPPDLPPGKKLEGELAGELVYHNHQPFLSVNAYSTEFAVTLKAGSKITASVTVLGKGRRVTLYLKDPTGKFLACPARGANVGSNTLVVEEVAASGKYTLVIVSEQIGAFTVKADYPAPMANQLKAEVATEASLTADIAKLEKEIAAKKAQLDELRKKK